MVQINKKPPKGDSMVLMPLHQSVRRSQHIPLNKCSEFDAVQFYMKKIALCVYRVKRRNSKIR